MSDDCQQNMSSTNMAPLTTCTSLLTAVAVTHVPKELVMSDMFVQCRNDMLGANYLLLLKQSFKARSIADHER